MVQKIFRLIPEEGQLNVVGGQSALCPPSAPTTDDSLCVSVEGAQTAARRGGLV